jgi:16S rRNA G966 N2-methylase RsmD
MSNPATPTKIANAIKDISRERAAADFARLKELAATQGPAAKTIMVSKSGCDCVDFFTFVERLHTVGYQGLSFFDFLEQLPTLRKKAYVKSMVAYYRRERPDTPPLKMWYRVFSLYFGSINIFRPAMALSIYRLVPKAAVQNMDILDFTMGWGGRLVAAAALGARSYTGIDLNGRLEAPYRRMADFLRAQGSTTRIECFFSDALKINYSALKYNFVLTSPPYYDLETYRGMRGFATKDAWDAEFYRPLFQKTMANLAPGGLYCLNVPAEIYDRVCVPLWGACKKRVPMSISSRNQGGQYSEFIYIWLR